MLIYYEKNRIFNLQIHNCTYDSIKDVLALLVSLEDETGIKPKVIMEATGNYSKPLQLFFASNGYKVIELNPILTHKQKKIGRLRPTLLIPTVLLGFFI